MAVTKRKKSERACVIGLDGVPYGMIVELARRGVMSTMARLMDIGKIHPMKASLPEVSAVSWTDFMTGTNAGTHGIFGFTDFKPDSYDVRFPNYLDVKAPTLWEKLGSKGRRSIVINQPSTYPARKIDGVLISGFVALELAKAVWPMSYRAALEQMGYQIDIDILKCRESPEVLWQELTKTMAGGQKALNHFWEEEWDYFEFVVTGTDRLHHFLWQAYEDTSHPSHERFLDFYRHIDRLIGKIVAAYHKLANTYAGFYILSDHGFTGIVQEVYLNAWLEQNGYLRFLKSEPAGLGTSTDGPGPSPSTRTGSTSTSRTGSPRARSKGRPAGRSRRRSPASSRSSNTRAAASSARSSSPRTSTRGRSRPRARTSSSSASRAST